MSLDDSLSAVLLSPNTTSKLSHLALDGVFVSLGPAEIEVL